jgi:hypothetical protein
MDGRDVWRPTKKVVPRLTQAGLPDSIFLSRFGHILEGLEMENIIYIYIYIWAIWNISLSFGIFILRTFHIFFGHLVYFYRFDML